MSRIVYGAFFIAAGIASILYGVLPHFSELAYNRSVMAGAPHVSGPIILPMIYAVAPVNYPLVVLGSALIAVGAYLIAAGIYGKLKPALNDDPHKPAP